MKRFVLIAVPVIAIGLAATLFLPLKNSEKTGTEQNPGATDIRDHVEIGEEKFTAAKIAIEAVSKRQIRSHHAVPGNVKYNETRHVEIKSPFDGLIRHIDVKVGDRVQEGQTIAVVDSPELGDKRADVMLRESDLRQAKNEFERWQTILLNLDDLLARLKRPQDAAQLEKEFADKPLGDFRQQILGSYAQMRLDQRLFDQLQNLAKGDFPENEKNRREAARNQSNAKFSSACEQAAFDVKQNQLKAEANMKDAENRLAVARQRLGLLVGQATEQQSESFNEASLSTWPVKAPFTGTIEEIKLAPKERILMAQGLFILADVSKLWVQADIRERDWSALSITLSQMVSVQTAAFPGKTFDAKVAYIGRAVAPETRAVPLIAEFDNSDGKFRPGMFVRVLIPEGEPRESVTIPQTAIATNDGRTFVFVETGPRQFHPRDVTTGISVDPWIEITSGLKPGEPIVVSGTAILKAELLLEPEE